MNKDNYKLLLITEDFPPKKGGVANYLSDFCETCMNEVVVLTCKHKDCAIDKEKQYKIIRKWFIMPYSSSNFIRTIFEAIQLFALFFYLPYYKFKYKINIFVFGYILPNSLVGIILKYILNIRVAVITYGLDIRSPLKKSFSKKFLLLMALNYSDKILTISNFTKNTIASLGIDNDKIFVYPPRVNPDKFKPESPDFNLIDKYNLGGEKIILTVGALVQRKGHDMVLQALPIVLKNIPNLVYLIVGTGIWESTIKRIVADLNLSRNVILCGNVSNLELPSYYNICDLFIMASREIVDNGDVEGFGIVFLEAAACGKPVIGGKSGGVSEAMIDGETGFLVDPTNPLEIAKYIEIILLDNKRALEMGKKGREFVINNNKKN
jgi:phosphatidylinositol alpha-1,6-mannosyltransferase